ncbi:hypothetical protein [Nocardia sp. CS682]|uniref:hypothetical protein n=1 Tax=Nocardia sp. CS682 TaxID=1047172 RepID=UPI00107581DB|nr:hypothetical protein [Nocardia sp. CS682]QBS42033.1 hypothetical protein DMB37_19710 [Nocardia sp. CS682]
MVRKSPQEKKQLSYAKDRRNIYGENDKASRKNLPRKRARVHRANRHRAHQDLLGATGPVDAQVSDAAETRLHARRPKAFWKHPDIPLGEYVRWKLARRPSR